MRAAFNDHARAKINMKTIWPQNNKVAFAIRDDDISFFSKPCMLRELHQRTWESGFKVSFSVIPCHKAINDLNVPPNYRGKRTYNPIANNTELVQFLLDGIKGKEVDIVQHGFSHEKISGKPEFAITDTATLEKMFNDGLTMLNTLFQTRITVFVPPWGHMSKQSVNMLRKSNFVTCGRMIRSTYGLENLSFISFSKPWTRSIISRFIRPFTKGLCKGVLELEPSFYFIIHSSKLSPEDTLEKMKRHFNYAYQKKGYFILVLHYWDFFHDWDFIIRDYKRCFDDFLGYVDSFVKVWKTSLSEIAWWFRKFRQKP